MSDRNSFDQLRDKLMSLYTAGDYAAALELVEQNEADFPEQSARTTFWKICLLSREGRLKEALATLRQGLQDGMWWDESQFADTDLDPLRDLPEFKDLVAESARSWEQGRKHIKREHLLLLPEAPSSAPYPLLVALHGRNGDKESNLEQWDVARRLGWAVLSAQSTQPLYPGSYCWDDPVTGLEDILFYLDQTWEAHAIDRERILIGGFSQGGGLAIYAALSAKLPVRGFIGGATWWAEVESLAPLATGVKNLRGYFICGGKDHTLERAREIQALLERHNISFSEEFHPDLGHEFPADFDSSFAYALEFIFKE
jgi:predicted esterase